MAGKNRSYNERELIAMIKGLAGNAAPDLVRGIGDDCAVISVPGEKKLWLLTIDTMTEKVHFDLAWHPPFLLGRKIVAVNISDIAAMGGRPRFALLAAAIPRSTEWFAEFVSGLVAALQEHDILLIGGDTVSTDSGSIFTLTLIGEADSDKVIYRSGARQDDLVWVSGRLGNAAAGLELCQRRAATGNRWQDLVKAHLDPEAQVKMGRLLAASGLVHAMIDLSDGLATDLAHLCSESRVGAELYADRIPMSDELREAAASLNVSALDLALKGGEDYHLLFSSSAAAQEVDELRRLAAESTGTDIYCIGRIIPATGVYLVQGGKRIEISYQGYDHFRH